MCVCIVCVYCVCMCVCVCVFSHVVCVRVCMHECVFVYVLRWLQKIIRYDEHHTHSLMDSEAGNWASLWANL